MRTPKKVLNKTMIVVLTVYVMMLQSACSSAKKHQSEWLDLPQARHQNDHKAYNAKKASKSSSYAKRNRY